MVKVDSINKKSLNTKCNTGQGSFNAILFCIFLFNVIFIPNDTFYLKIVSLLFLLIVNMGQILTPRTSDEKVVVFFGLIITSVTIIWSIILTGDFITNIKSGYPGYILLLYVVLKRSGINFYSIFIRLLRLLTYVIVLISLLDLLHLLDLYKNPIVGWYNDTENAMIGKGDHLAIRYMFFIKTTPLLFVLLVSDLKHRKFIGMVVTSIAIVLSGTRANIILLLSVIVIWLCFLQPNRKYRYVSACFLFLICLYLLIDNRVINYFVDMFQRKSSSDDVRSGHLLGVFEAWKNNFADFFLGTGYSSKFYSYGGHEFVSNMELSYWNLLRQVGVIPFCLMMVMYLYPIIKLIKYKDCHCFILAYIAYLIIAYTNPFLYSSTGVTMVLFMYYLCYLNKKKFCKMETI